MKKDDEYKKMEKKENNTMAAKNNGPDIPEEFQTQFQELCAGVNEHQLSYMRSIMNKREDELQKKNKPEFSTEGMPS